jgi:iron-sulfur cluster insertion protein
MTTIAPPLHLTENAARRVRFLQQRKNNSNLMLRLMVEGGGCSGFQYKFSFAEDIDAEDRVFEEHGVKLLVDEASLEFLQGVEIDYAEAMIGAAFQIKNPLATSSCGCGNSFAV